MYQLTEEQLLLQDITDDTCHLKWLPADEYHLEYSASPDFDPILDSVEISDAVTEYDYNVGTATKGFFRLVLHQ